MRVELSVGAPDFAATVRASMESGARNRIRMSLRAERAFGLTTIALPASPVAAKSSKDDVAIEEANVARTWIAATLQQASTACASAPAAVKAQRPVEQASATVQEASERDDPVAGTLPPGGLMPIPSAEPFTAPVLSRAEKVERLKLLDEREVRGCTRCELCRTRKNTVFGEGDPDARLLFIGEGPGENEDLSGRPFVGRAGDKLNDMIGAMGLTREQVFIVNIVKCRPPNNRVPDPIEVATCTPYLVRQIEIIRPRVIVTLGLPSAKYMLNDSKLAMGRIRGDWREWRGIKLMPTYHPAFLLRSYTPENRAAVWSDLKMVMEALGLKAPVTRQDE
jgi:DNA polymerase